LGYVLIKKLTSSELTIPTPSPPVPPLVPSPFDQNPFFLTSNQACKDEVCDNEGGGGV